MSDTLSYASCFGNLRSLLSQEMSNDLWCELRDVLENMRSAYAPAYYREVLPYVKDVLKQSHPLRLPAPDWVRYEEPSRGEHEGAITIMDSRFELCNAVSLGFSNPCFDLAHKMTEFAHIEHLFWQGYRVVPHGLFTRVLGNCTSSLSIPDHEHCFSNLKSLAFKRMTFTRQGFDSLLSLLQSHAYPKLETLYWVGSGKDMETQILTEMIDRGDLGTVKTLDFQSPM